jgi:hypothetical protein
MSGLRKVETLKHIEAIGTVAYLGGVMSVPEPFAWSWSQMVEFNHGALCEGNERIHYDRSRLGLHDFARNEICGRMLGDWVMMLDTDMQFEPDFVARLVRLMLKHNLDVVTGIYQFKSPPHSPALYHFNGDTERYEHIGGWDQKLELFQVDSAGAGCLLIRRRVLERIRDELKVNPFVRVGQKGEDHSFFTRVKELGIKAHCAWRVQAGHLAYKPIALSDRTDAQGLGEYEVEGLLAG